MPEPLRDVSSVHYYCLHSLPMTVLHNIMIYREEVEVLEQWCKTNRLTLNVRKTKEMITDFRKYSVTHPPLLINNAAVEIVESFKFLGVHITDDFSWNKITSLVKKAQQQLHFLRKLKKAGTSNIIMINFHRCIVESILPNNITVWFGSCSAADRR